MYTLQETAVVLNISIATVRRMVNSGLIPAVKIGQQWRIKEDVLQSLRENGIGGNNED